VIRTLDHVATPDPDWRSDAPDPATAAAPFRLYNIGANAPVPLMDFIGALEECLGLEAKKNFLPLQAGDVPDTYADVSALVADVGYKPATPIKVGIANFVSWYKEYYGIK
jgi:UDP-glucuronate 4-epimerase